MQCVVAFLEKPKALQTKHGALRVLATPVSCFPDRKSRYCLEKKKNEKRNWLQPFIAFKHNRDLTTKQKLNKATCSDTRAQEMSGFEPGNKMERTRETDREGAQHPIVIKEMTKVGK